MHDLLWRVEGYFDTLPREHARVEQVGPFTLFAGDPAGWTFCARPRLDRSEGSVAGTSSYDAASVRTVLRRMRELGLPEVIEWVHEVTPDLHALARARAVGALAFAAPGTAVGGSGEAEREAAVDPVPERMVDAMREQRVGWVVAEDPSAAADSPPR